MNKILAIAVISLTLTGCAQIKSWIPSFWDDNQSHSIVNLRVSVDNIDCGQPQLAQARRVEQDLKYFRYYSESKGWRQQDVLKLTEPIKETLDDWIKRSEQKEGSKTYCELKKRVLEQQTKRAAEAVLGRF